MDYEYCGRLLGFYAWFTEKLHRTAPSSYLQWQQQISIFILCTKTKNFTFSKVVPSIWPHHQHKQNKWKLYALHFLWDHFTSSLPSILSVHGPQKQQFYFVRLKLNTSQTFAALRYKYPVFCIIYMYIYIYIMCKDWIQATLKANVSALVNHARWIML